MRKLLVVCAILDSYIQRAFNCPTHKEATGGLSVVEEKPEDKVRVTIEMVDVVTQISADNEREKNHEISEEELISRLRRRFRLDERFRSR